MSDTRDLDMLRKLVLDVEHGEPNNLNLLNEYLRCYRHLMRTSYNKDAVYLNELSRIIPFIGYNGTPRVNIVGWFEYETGLFSYISKMIDIMGNSPNNNIDIVILCAINDKFVLDGDKVFSFLSNILALNSLQMLNTGLLVNGNYDDPHLIKTREILAPHISHYFDTGRGNPAILSTLFGGYSPCREEDNYRANKVIIDKLVPILPRNYTSTSVFTLLDVTRPLGPQFATDLIAANVKASAKYATSRWAINRRIASLLTKNKLCINQVDGIMGNGTETCKDRLADTRTIMLDCHLGDEDALDVHRLYLKYKKQYIDRNKNV